MTADRPYIGTAGWTIPKTFSAPLPAGGSHLQRYASVFNCVEINSSFYREHLPKSYARWAESVPENFRFSLKLLKRFTHEQRLQVQAGEMIPAFGAMNQMGVKFAVLLVQLPPSLDFSPETARHFFAELRERFNRAVVFEPRHASWTGDEALRILEEFEISKVNADPEPCPLKPGRCRSDISYHRLHGSPEIYRSAYSEEFLASQAQAMRTEIEQCIQSWCIFDNTTFGHATQNAYQLMRHF